MCVFQCDTHCTSGQERATAPEFFIDPACQGISFHPRVPRTPSQLELSSWRTGALKGMERHWRKACVSHFPPESTQCEVSQRSGACHWRSEPNVAAMIRAWQDTPISRARAGNSMNYEFCSVDLLSLNKHNVNDTATNPLIN